jgi:gas vesicle protein
MNKSTKRFALGTIFAAVIGYVAGILTAPKSGKETREDIKEGVKHGIVEAEKQLKQLHTQLNEVIEEAKTKAIEFKGKALDELEQLVGKSKAAKEKARELLSNIHEGEADDKELKKAIDDANKAVEHLRNYLKKV